jgi:cell division protein FtsL
VLILAAMIVGLAALLPLVQSSGATTTAGNIRRLEQEREDMQARLQELEVRVAGLGSLSRIEHEATTRLKMVKPQEVHYIRVDAPAPAPHRLPSRYLPQPADSSSAGSSLWEDVFGWLPLP